MIYSATKNIGLLASTACCRSVSKRERMKEREREKEREIKRKTEGKIKSEGLIERESERVRMKE